MSKGLKKTYRLFDRLIIIPISRLVFNIRNMFKRNGGTFDKMLNRPAFLIILSLILTAVLFISVEIKANLLVKNNAEVITNVPVIVKYNEEAYVIEGVPETVDIIISGDKDDVVLAKQLGEFSVTLDLTKYTASDAAYKVYFTYTKSISNLSYKLDPSYVYVTIKNKVSQVNTVSYEYINQDKLDTKLSVKNISLSKSEVVVKGSEDTLNKIASIKALVDLSDSDLTEARSYDIDNIKLVAYDNSGDLINNIEIVPNTLSATLSLESYSANVPIVVKTVGTLVSGKAISSILINGQSSYSITAYGSETEISNLANIPVTINVDGAGNNNVEKYNVNITKPNGIRYISTSNLAITLTFGSEAEPKEISLVNNISPKNLGANLKATIITKDDVTVICKGVASVIDNITAKDINAYVDLSGLGVGEHNVEVKIDNNNPLVTYVVSSTIKVKISN